MSEGGDDSSNGQGPLRRGFRRSGWLLAIPILGGAVLGFYALRGNMEQDRRVRVSTPFQQGLTADQTPVETELYDYVGGEGSRSHYRVTGEPLRFSFRKSFYLYQENQRGGPQGSITLVVDKTTFEPISEVINRSTNISSINTIDMNAEMFRESTLYISVQSNYLPIFAQRGLWEEKWTHYYQQKYLEYCGIQLYLTRDNPTEIRVADEDPLHKNLIGEVGRGDNWRGLTCSSEASICRVSFEYKNREATFDIEKSKICNFEDRLSKVSALLDRHVRN